MNKPIRTVAVFCLLLFLALMVNATWLQYVRTDDYADDPRNRRIIEAAYSAERGAILVGREAVAESEPSDDEYKFQRVYDQPLKYSHITGWFSYFSQTGIERSQNDVLSGDDSLLFVTRLADLLTMIEQQRGEYLQSLRDLDARLATDGHSPTAELMIEDAVLHLKADLGWLDMIEQRLVTSTVPS